MGHSVVCGVLGTHLRKLRSFFSMENKASYKKFLCDKHLGKTCPDCYVTISPYSKTCGCRDQLEYKCVICREPITPYNIHKIYELNNGIYHQCCIEIHRMLVCACGERKTPYSLKRHNKCSPVTESCLYCKERITPFSKTIGGFCSKRCINSNRKFDEGHLRYL